MPSTTQRSKKAKQKLPEKLTVPKNCVCDTYGLNCQPGKSVFSFKKTKGGWEVGLDGGTPQLSPFTDQDIERLLSRCKVKKGNSLHFALQQVELERYMDLSPEDIEKLPKNKFLLVVREVVAELIALEEQLKRVDAVFKRIRAARLLRLCAEYKGQVVQIKDVLFQYTERNAPVSYQRVLEKLVETKPSLRKLVDELVEAERLAGGVVPTLHKDLENTMPATWRKLERVKLSNLPQPSIPVRQIELMLHAHIEFLQEFLDSITGVTVAQTHRHFVALESRDRQQKLEQTIDVLQSIDFGIDPNTILPLLERARKMLMELDIKPTDVELAIRELAANKEKAEKYIKGPSGRGSGKGAIGDLQAILAQWKGQAE